MSRYAEGTDVPVSKSRAEIEATIARYGATAFGMVHRNEASVIVFEAEGRRIQIEVPMPTMDELKYTPTGRERSREAYEAAREGALRQRWRALALVIKAKLEAIESGISSVEEEFLAHVVVPGSGGKTVAKWLLPQLEESYLKNKMPPLLGSGQ
jgi:hypothetical protein